jgi:hypothetical protein
VGKARHKHRTEPGGPPCPRCSTAMVRIVRTHVGRSQHRQPFYFRFWYRCLVPTCATKNVMPARDRSAVHWNVAPFPIEQYFSGERRRERPERARSGGTIAVGILTEPAITTPHSVGTGRDASDASCPFDLPETSGDIVLETLDQNDTVNWK